MENKSGKGAFFEQQALHWLQKQNLNLVKKNYHARFGEIDLIMIDGKTLCFIEVKYRQDNAFGGTAYSIPLLKQKKITKSALCFISQNNKYQQHNYRFDALFIQPGKNEESKVEWIQNAFCIDDSFR